MSTKDYEAVGIRTRSGAPTLFCTHFDCLQFSTSEPHETANDKNISFIVNSSLIFNQDNVRLIIEIKIEIDIENPNELQNIASYYQPFYWLTLVWKAL